MPEDRRLHAIAISLRLGVCYVYKKNMTSSSDTDSRLLDDSPALARDRDATIAFGACRILVAEDNPVNQQVAIRMLEKLGCRTEIASDGDQAVRMHDAQAYDLLLMDCQMPKLDGYQATAAIRAAERLPRHTPIIALTACTSQAQQDKCIAAGMDDFLSKPIQPQTLKQTLMRWLPLVLQAQPASDTADCGDRLETMHAMFGTDFAELAALYRRDSPQRIASLRRAGAVGDSLQVARIAHAFGGSCASIGARALFALCKELELRAGSGIPDDFEKRLAAIDAEYRWISARLQSMSGLPDCQ